MILQSNKPVGFTTYINIQSLILCVYEHNRTSFDLNSADVVRAYH